MVHPSFLDTSRATEINHWTDLSNFMGSNTSYVGIIRQDISNISPISNISFNTSKTFYGSKKDGTYPVLSPSGTMNGPLINSNSGDVYLYNLDISGFHNTHQGPPGTAVAYISENIYINNCNIHDNSGFSTIWATTGNIIGNSIFSHNTGDQGGAISATHNITITNGNIDFSHNKAINGPGGAMFADTWSAALLFITNATVNFNNNIASGHGGAIYFPGQITITNSNVTFFKNSCGDMGGAIQGEKIDLSADAAHKIIFTGNTATSIADHIYATTSINYTGSSSDISFTDPSCSSSGVIVWPESDPNPRAICPSNT